MLLLMIMPVLFLVSHLNPNGLQFLHQIVHLVLRLLLLDQKHLSLRILVLLHVRLFVLRGDHRFLDAAGHSLELIFLHFLDVLVNLEENDFERRLVLQKVEDLEVFFVELGFCLVHEQFELHRNFFEGGNSLCGGVKAEGKADDLLEGPDAFQEEDVDVFGVGALESLLEGLVEHGWRLVTGGKLDCLHELLHQVTLYRCVQILGVVDAHVENVVYF